MTENENILLHLRQGLPGFSPTLQKLGNFILTEPQRVLYLTITELAKESETSEASVTRLCRHLRCKGYTEFKMALALDIQQSHPDTPDGGDNIDILVEESVQALRDTGKFINREVLRQAGLALHQASSIQIYGVAASAITGDYLHYRLLRLGKSALLFNDMHRAAMNASTVKEGDLVIAISSSGSTKDLMYAVKLASKQKARVLMLSNTLSSPLGKLADMLLVAARPEGPLNAGSLSAKVGTMLLVEVLIRELMTHDSRYSTLSQQTASATLPMLI
ncbi:MurR/RpiR family transcriptional regulator [Pantoea piersonii]|jgi:RpiR family carbohydrate utilization transcriptional regulator|uniref:MurR/RpiR family transcriptional regulator n=1 Tax=Pantoea piersonii TaxID=2364647 RepID=UPI000EA33F01|nr:MurR/RpiR family transcriptional regulator [Pantoea piersonii]MBZ6384582.1 MurR/RpiR family transcriptional regulator [Pantoea piersonii]MBZ6398244.1 MurR/RpiR family transcriptional regulator [Pantoea piersonii]MBZ6406951.1 MurR/RpiR family transcriptional regulator [Pantoea piersonii]MBZ6425229.1 MurR/RpiR family transcriptional regulator [Pantoea piersonii]NYB01727.1 MurR/RpiR family transcriptional regulator [Pantoea piersonii]